MFHSTADALIFFIVICIIAATFGTIGGIQYKTLKKQRQASSTVSDKSRFTVLVLALLFGEFGIHRFTWVNRHRVNYAFTAGDLVSGH